MEKRVSAADASRRFSELLREVQNGQSYVITSHGRAAARFVPLETDDRSVARAALLARLKGQAAAKAAKGRTRWTRDELYAGR